jgi:hypothetical protein
MVYKNKNYAEITKISQICIIDNQIEFANFDFTLKLGKKSFDCQEAIYDSGSCVFYFPDDFTEKQIELGTEIICEVLKESNINLVEKTIGEGGEIS